MPASPKHLEHVRIALVELRRLFQRSELAKEWAAAFGASSKLDYTELRLLDAVRGSTPRAGGDGGATVGEIAERMGIDPSRASRLVARSVKRRVLSRHAADGDGRRVVLRVTPAGGRLQEMGVDLTRSRIALALDGWPASERAAFAELFHRFAQAIARPGSPGRAASPEATRRSIAAAPMRTSRPRRGR